jgi:hypothetical protein
MRPSSVDVDGLWSEHRRSGSARALGELYDALSPELLRVALHIMDASSPDANLNREAALRSHAEGPILRPLERPVKRT